MTYRTDDTDESPSEAYVVGSFFFLGVFFLSSSLSFPLSLHVGVCQLISLFFRHYIQFCFPRTFTVASTFKPAINHRKRKTMDIHEDSGKTPTNNHCISNEIAAIYTSTFQHVGMEFIDALMREITVQAQVDSALFLQLLSPEEYKEISDIYMKDGKSRLHVVSCAVSTTSSPEIQHSSCSSGDDPSPSSNVDSTSDGLQDQFLLIRSCFSNQASMKSRYNSALWRRHGIRVN